MNLDYSLGTSEPHYQWQCMINDLSKLRHLVCNFSSQAKNRFGNSTDSFYREFICYGGGICAFLIINICYGLGDLFQFMNPLFSFLFVGIVWQEP